MDANFPNETFPKIYILLFVLAFFTSAGSGRGWIGLARKRGLIDSPGPRKIHSQPIPIAGGLMIATGILVPFVIGLLAAKLSLLGEPLSDFFEYGLNKRSWQLAGIIGGAIGMLGLGIVDDRGALPAGKKLLMQSIILIFVVASGTRITLFIPNLMFSYAITLLWFLVLINAFNFTDNMNGLCAGLATISAVIFAFHAALPGHYLVASMGFLVAGALLGFVPFNYPKAQTFLGDGGSHLVGYLIAVMAVLPHFYHANQPDKLGVIKPILILGIVLIDFVWILMLRLWRGKPIYIGDTNHLSHQIVRRGFSKRIAVLILWCIHGSIAACSFLI